MINAYLSMAVPRFRSKPVSDGGLSFLQQGALVFLAQSDFHDPGFLVPFALAILGLTLSIGMTASSIANMGAVDASKGGAAGLLEATGYELGVGLGITLSASCQRPTQRSPAASARGADFRPPDRSSFLVFM